MAVFKTQKEKLTTDGPDKLNRIVDGANIKGDMTILTSIRIDGTVEGNINCAAKLVLGESGKIVGNILSQHAEIEGHIEGELVIQERLVLKNTARITGNIQTQSIIIEEGAIFDGVCKMKNTGKFNAPTTQKVSEKAQEGMVY
jgi:cytoskeletal protein CcmA (bactofilin family)